MENSTSPDLGKGGTSPPKRGPLSNFESQGGMRPVNLMTPAEIKREKFQIWKNITVISLSFMCLFTAFNSVSNLQVRNPSKTAIPLVNTVLSH